MSEERVLSVVTSEDGPADTKPHEQVRLSPELSGPVKASRTPTRAAKLVSSRPVVFLVGVVLLVVGVLFFFNGQSGQTQAATPDLEAIEAEEERNAQLRKLREKALAANGRKALGLETARASVSPLPSGAEHLPPANQPTGLPIPTSAISSLPPPSRTFDGPFPQRAPAPSPEEEARRRSLEEAMKAPSRVDVAVQDLSGGAASRSRARSSGSLRTRRTPSESPSRLATSQGGRQLPPGLVAQLVEGGGQSDSKDQSVGGYGQFQSEGGRDWTNRSQLRPPPTAYTLATTAVIPATLIQGINSEVPGPMTAQVSRDVFDTATQRHLLIPQGARLFGKYASQTISGQSRVLVGWQRIVFPNGCTYDIGAMPGTDQAGYAGFKDLRKTGRLQAFGEAILLSGILAGIGLATSRGQQSLLTSPSAGDVLAAQIGQTLGSQAREILGQASSRTPKLQIRPGYNLNVAVVKDLVFDEAYDSEGC